jgi:hypothetical protein
MFLCVLGQVFFRYFLGDPTTWSDELARYLFVWCSLLGWVIAARRRSHLAIGSLPERASPSCFPEICSTTCVPSTLTIDAAQRELLRGLLDERGLQATGGVEPPASGQLELGT